MRKLYWEIAPVAALLMLATACPSNNEHAKATPAKQANAPAIAAANKTAAVAPSAKTAPASQPEGSSKSDPVPDLIARVQTEYRAGQDNYKAGHLEAAKQNFDRAF